MYFFVNCNVFIFPHGPVQDLGCRGSKLKNVFLGQNYCHLSVTDNRPLKASLLAVFFVWLFVLFF